MFRCFALLPHPLATALAVLGLLLAPLPAAAEATLTTGDAKASASLNIRIVVPPVMRVIENSHPTQVDGRQPVEQRLVVLSNLRHGFCASLRLSDPQLAHWQLQTEQVGGVTLQPVAGGYRVCASRPGRYTLRLQHDFGGPADPATAMAWPVQTEFMAL
jgi:hypothetical protein